MTLPNGSYSVRANVLLDCRADSTFVREDIDKTSQLEGAHNPLKIQNTFLYSGQIASKLVSFKILSNHHPRKIEISKDGQYQNCRPRTQFTVLRNSKKGTITSKEYINGKFVRQMSPH